MLYLANNRNIMKDYFKYGIATAIIWNILIVLMAIIAASIRQVEYSYFFDDGIGGIGICLFLIAWSLIWFYIGYHSRRKFIQKKLFYKEMAPSIDDKLFNQEYTAYYFSKQAKLLSILLVTAIPWHAIGYIRKQLDHRDLIIISVLATLAVLSFGIYKWLKKKVTRLP